MADDMEYALSCSICMELYKEPMLLPCAHSLCKACLEKLRRPTDKIVSRTIDCPHCRQKLDLGDKCQNVKKNFQLASIIDIYIQDSNRRQQLDAAKPIQQQGPVIPQQQTTNPRPTQAAKPKGFLAQLRQKQNQRQQQKSNKSQSKPSSTKSPTEPSVTSPSAEIASAIASLRRTSQGSAPQSPVQDTEGRARPMPRRPAPPPPPQHIVPSTAMSPDSMQPPPVPRRSYKLEDVYENIDRVSRMTEATSPTEPESSISELRSQPRSPEQSAEDQLNCPDIHQARATHSAGDPLSTPTTVQQPDSLPQGVPQPGQSNSSATVLQQSTTQDPSESVSQADATTPGDQIRNDAEINSTLYVLSPLEINNQLTPDCSTCERVPPNQATVNCITCSFFFCGSCLGTFHPDPHVAHHEIKPIKEIELDAKCVLCEKAKWTKFCMECELLICGGCQLGHHPAELNHWMHEAPLHRSMSLRNVTSRPTPPSDLPMHRQTSVPSGMGAQTADAAKLSDGQCISCSKTALVRCLDCEENLCKQCAENKHASQVMKTHTFLRVSKENVEKLVQRGLVELMLLKQVLMGELSSKMNED